MIRHIGAGSDHPSTEAKHPRHTVCAPCSTTRTNPRRPTLAELIRAIDGAPVAGPLPAGCSPAFGSTVDPETAPVGFSAIDSRTVRPGEIFWALRGAHCDGNEFAADALQRGAAAAVIDRLVEPAATEAANGSFLIADKGDSKGTPPDHPAPAKPYRPASVGPLLVVDDVPTALNRWAAWRRQRFNGVMIGVTGSAGKTTTRAMIDHLLGSCAQGTATPGNWNNELGVPLSLARLRPGDDYAVIEIGARHSGDVAQLAAAVRPHWGVITCIGEAHLESFGSREAIARTKAELLAALPADGLALLGDDEHLRRAARCCPCRVIIAGTSDDCHLRAERVEHRPGSLRFRLQGQQFDLPLWGEHLLTSAVLAAGAAREFGLAWSDISSRLADFQPVARRCAVFSHRGATIIDDSYNSSPSAATAALKLLGAVESATRRIAILGEMAELGAEAAAQHWHLGTTAVREGRVGLLIACGPHAAVTVAGACQAGLPRRQAIACPSVEDLLRWLPQLVRPGDAVLVKGSRIMAMDRVADALRAAPAAVGETGQAN